MRKIPPASRRNIPREISLSRILLRSTSWKYNKKSNFHHQSTFHPGRATTPPYLASARNSKILTYPAESQFSLLDGRKKLSLSLFLPLVKWEIPECRPENFRKKKPLFNFPPQPSPLFSTKPKNGLKLKASPTALLRNFMETKSETILVP